MNPQPLIGQPAVVKVHAQPPHTQRARVVAAATRCDRGGGTRAQSQRPHGIIQRKSNGAKDSLGA